METIPLAITGCDRGLRTDTILTQVHRITDECHHPLDTAQIRWDTVPTAVFNQRTD